MADAVAALTEINAHVAALSRAIDSGRSKYIAVAVAQPIAREIATKYFELVRTDLDSVKSRAGLTDEIDFVVQQLLHLADSSREKHAYLGQIPVFSLAN